VGEKDAKNCEDNGKNWMPMTKKTSKETSNFGGKKTYNLWRFF